MSFLNCSAIRSLGGWQAVLVASPASNRIEMEYGAP
jgi:hypothetical protein